MLRTLRSRYNRWEFEQEQDGIIGHHPIDGNPDHRGGSAIRCG